MSSEIIYERKYSPMDDSLWDDISKGSSLSEKERSELEARLLQIPHEVSFVPSQTHITNAEKFIKLAKDAAWIYDFDVRIEKSDWNVKVTYSFDGEREDCSLSELFAMANHVSFYSNRNDRTSTIVLDYPLFDMVRNGKVVYL